MRVSVITPSFNQAAYLERTLRSVLEQDWPEIEYLVVDGGSTDGSVEILERYADRLAWWVSEPDRGQTDALNKALSHASGDVVSFVNSDDEMLPGAVRAAAERLQAGDATWAVGACRFVDDDDGEKLLEVWKPELPTTRRAAWILAPWSVPQPSSFWRKDVFERHGRFREDLNYVFDTEFFLRLALSGEMPALIEKELAVRHLHGEAKSADLAPFQAEQRQLPSILGPLLGPHERLELVLRRALLRR